MILLRKTKKTLGILSVFLVLNVIIEIVAFLISEYSINNMFVFHIHTVIEFAFVVWVALKIIKPVRATEIAIILPAAFLVFSIIDAFYIENLDSLNSLPRGIEGLIVIAISVFFFYRLFNSEENFDLLKYPYFWLFSGWLIYFSGTFFLFIYNNMAGFTITFPVIHSVLNILLNLVFTYTLWLGSRKLTYQ